MTLFISFFFFSNNANTVMMAMPRAMPATYQIHVQPKFVAACQIMVSKLRHKKPVPRNRYDRMRLARPMKIPMMDNPANTNGNHGACTTPMRKTSSVDER